MCTLSRQLTIPKEAEDFSERPTTATPQLLVFQMMDDRTVDQLDSLIKLREYVSTIDCDFQLIVRVIPRLMGFLAGDNRNFQTEAAWILTNLASGTTSDTKAVVDAGAVPILVQLSKDKSMVNSELRTQCFWGLSNIAGESVLYRDLVISHGGLESILDELHIILDINTVISTAALKVDAWALCNFCRSKPSPKLSLSTAVDVIVPMLKQMLQYDDDLEVVSYACWTMSYLLSAFEGFAFMNLSQAICDDSTCSRLVHLLDFVHGSTLLVTPQKQESCSRINEDETVDIQSGALAVISHLAKTEHQLQQLLSWGLVVKLVRIQKSPKVSIQVKQASLIIDRMVRIVALKKTQTNQSKHQRRNKALLIAPKKKTYMKFSSSHRSPVKITLNLRQQYLRGVLSDRSTRKYLKSII